ncbi:MAG: hypothetical protein C5B55_11220 [Blastocatellia bacterium]|nr:MAG: hypothetical protein C5B55_11220 [Blastocatellia bacterium]
MNHQTFDALILGAGAAGLAAATEMSRGGLRTIIIEARDRIGGRIYTRHNRTSSVPIELGAEFVHGRPPELFELIDEAQLKVEEVTGRHWFFDDGKLVKPGEFWSKVEELMNGMKLGQPDISFKDYLATLPNDEHTARAKAIATRYVEGFHAARLDRIGVHGLIKANEAADDVHGDKMYRIADGYEGIAQWLLHQAQANNSVLRLNTRVNELRWRSGNVEVLCSSADSEGLIQAGKVVVTVPPSLIKQTLRFSPPLPTAILQAMEYLPIGDVVRIVLEFKRRFWAGLDLRSTDEDLSELSFIHYPDAFLPTWWTLYPDPSAVLVGWAGGPRATKLSSGSGQLLRTALDSLSSIFGVSYDQLKSELREFHFHDWRNDSLTRGGYTYVAVNGLAAQQLLAQPLADTIFFAGEALAVGHIGTVHGAIATGKRAAKQILDK